MKQYISPQLLHTAQHLRDRVIALRPFPEETLKSLREYYRIGLTYSSNALEGNSLTESETKVVIEDGLTIEGKPLRDMYEAVGHAHAYDFDGNGRVARLILNLALIRGEYTIALIPEILRHEYVQSLEASHKNPSVFINFIAERIIATQMDLLRLLADGGVNGGVKGGASSKGGGVNLEELIFETIQKNPGINAPAIADILQKSLRTTQRYLKSLSDANRIAFRGAPKNGGYHVL